MKICRGVKEAPRAKGQGEGKSAGKQIKKVYLLRRRVFGIGTEDGGALKLLAAAAGRRIERPELGAGHPTLSRHSEVPSSSCRRCEPLHRSLGRSSDSERIFE